MTRTSTSLHRPTLFRQSSPGSPRDGSGSGRGFRTPRPAPHWETQGTQRTKLLPRSQAGQGQDFPGGPATKTLRSQCSRHRPSPLAGDLLISPHIPHQAAQDPAHGKSQQGHTKSGNSHHALKGWGKGVEEQRAELRPWQGTVNTPREGPWPSPVAGAVFPVL